MKILLCHNYYQQSGGEDAVFAAEADLLEANGHEVLRFTRHNDAIDGMARIEVARRTLWNEDAYRQLRGLMRRERPGVMHCTNTFPLISPAAYYAARAEQIPVVQSLHNYRLFCANALLLRDGRVCEACLGRLLPWPALRYGCYRGSRAASAVVAGQQVAHRFARTWIRRVDVFIALSEFSRRKFIQGGLPARRLAVKPNFVPDPGAGRGRGGYLVFAGRLSEEKGLRTLLAAWSRLRTPVPLKILGDGPLAPEVEVACARSRMIQWLGRRDSAEVLDIVGDAAGLVVPSLCYEHFPRTIAEAYAKGTPVIASRLGAVGELVDEGQTGLRFAPGDADDLAGKVHAFMADPAAQSRMRRACRQEYEQKYTAARNYAVLVGIYERALAGRKALSGV